MTVAILFARADSNYKRLPDCDVWDAERDARRWKGGCSVVAHPPCRAWGRLRHFARPRPDEKALGLWAADQVRKWGGVLEHPAYSDAWAAFDLPRPMRSGGWSRGSCGGWSAHVEQGRYGHPAKKATWLYAFGTELPALKWGYVAYQQSSALVSWCGNHVKSNEKRPRVGKAAAARSPIAFRDALISMARSVRRQKEVMM